MKPSNVLATAAVVCGLIGLMKLPFAGSDTGPAAPDAGRLPLPDLERLFADSTGSGLNPDQRSHL